MLNGYHYQNAYLCHDLDKGIDHLRRYYQFGDIVPMNVDQQVKTNSGLKHISSRIAFIWVDNLQIELIQPLEDETGVYQWPAHAQDASKDALYFHHSCARVADWEKFRASVDQQDLPLLFERADNNSDLKFLYLDGRKLCGHYLEFTWMSDMMWQRLGGSTPA